MVTRLSAFNLNDKKAVDTVQYVLVTSVTIFSLIPFLFDLIVYIVIL